MTENYILPNIEDATIIAGGIRVFGDRLAADVALITSPSAFEEGGSFPFLPWLGFAYHFDF